MLYMTYTLNILLMLAIPIGLGIFLVKKKELEGRWWWIGATILIASQIILLPIQDYVINPYLNNLSYSGALPSIAVLILGGLLLGLWTGVCVELLRYAMFRWWVKDARSFESGFLLGAGHAGAASIILAFLVIYNFVNMILVRNMDPASLAPADQVQMVQSQITAFWSAPWYYTLREAIGQIFTLPIEISLALMVLQAFTRKQWQWVTFSIGFHSLVEASRVIALNLTNDFQVNAVLGVFAIISVLIICRLRRRNTTSNSLDGALGKATSMSHTGN